MIETREFEPRDRDTTQTVHKQNGLHLACLPDTENPLFVTKQVAEIDKQFALAIFIKVIGEAYLIMNHEVSTPEERWKALQVLVGSIEADAKEKGLQEYSCWVPPEIAKSFDKRLKDLGFIKSEWACYSKPL